MEQGSLREVTRRAARTRIAEIAEGLFVQDGFETTTVDTIAAAVGMSQRTFFRYFASKEDVVLDNYERMGEKLLERLRARPAGESDWAALRRAFDVVAEQYSDADQRLRGATVQQIVEASPVLLSAFLEKLDRIQRRLAEELHARTLEGSLGATSDALVVRAVVGAAFACLQSAVSDAAHSAEPTDLGASLDVIMAAVQPICFVPGR